VAPTIQFVGGNGYPLDQLTFRTSAYSDPQSDPFAAMEWRIAEITDPATYKPGDPLKFEITSTWESGEQSTFNDSITIPSESLKVGSTYRVRLRMKDSQGYWSHWSAPVQFVASAPVSSDLAGSLRISEVHYNPADPSTTEMAAGFTSGNEFEFIELVNSGARPIDPRGAQLSGGIDFDFADCPVKELAPGQRLLIVENLEAFRMRYGDGLPVAGEWSGQLANEGETLVLSAFGSKYLEFTFDDEWYPETDGDGRSLEAVDPATTTGNAWSQKVSWKSSASLGGTPGRGSSEVIPGDSNHDGIFNSSDLVKVFIAGEYEDGIPGNSTFDEGDWNGDNDFTTADMVLAFISGRYVAAARRETVNESVAARTLSQVEFDPSLKSRWIDSSDSDAIEIPVRRIDSTTARDLVFDEWRRDEFESELSDEIDEIAEL
jgi:hypothetical protein